MSSERADGRRTRRRRSHHWYWVAAIPATFLLWLATLAWLAVASSWEAFGFGTNAVELSLVALGVPFVILTAYFPMAVYRDADYVNRTSGQWAPQPMRQAMVAAAGLAVFVLVGLGVVLSDFPPSWPVIAGFVVSVPFAAYYVWRRHETVGTP
jgi:ribose/xylose/arabinose/galactoside ABC-type transport system permease subunit